ncbi:MAG: undecaprenyl-diphosphatase UppP [Leptospiraceae bacterium]|nr:undecaprenyl-diphosphatase UppP [Leptospiraceae bacterium]
MIEIKIWQAIVLGIVQGLTEFVPVSSTAHLKIISVISTALGQHFPDPGAAYSAVIQLGTLLSLLIFFREDLWNFGRAAIIGLFSGRPFASQEARLSWFLVLGTIPVSVAGLLLSDFIKGPFRSLYVIAFSLILLALVLWLADHLASKTRDINQMTWMDALLIGVGQSVALIPGSSRSGTTLTAGLFMGFSRYAAMRFSFLLAIPAIALSGVYELIKDYHELESAGLVGLALGTLTSAVVGYITVAGLLHYLRTHSTLLFVVYRVLLGVTLLVLLWWGVLEA